MTRLGSFIAGALAPFAILAMLLLALAIFSLRWIIATIEAIDGNT